MSIDCVFCRIIRGELPARRLFENDEVIAILNLYPVQPGHALILPKVHVETFFEASEPVLASWIMVAQRVARALQAATGCPGLNLGQNNGKAAGQEIPHLQLHLIPRYHQDGLGDWPNHALDVAYADALTEDVKRRLAA